MLSPKVCHIFQTGKSKYFKLGAQTEHEDPHHRHTPLQGQSSRSPGKLTVVGTNYYKSS